MRSLLTACLLSACGQVHVLTADATAELRLPSDDPLVYEGTVARRDGTGDDLFRYERRVRDVDEGLRSTHRTFTPEGAPVVLHEALHTSDYELLSFREIHGQSGLQGEVEVHADGSATFTVDGRSRTEAPGAPLQVGPTLFGYVLAHWDELDEGLEVRFVVLERGRSFRFRLQRVDEGHVEMNPANPLLGLFVPTADLWFDEGREIVRYEGLVPPLEPVTLTALDATVSYRHAAPYR